MLIYALQSYADAGGSYTKGTTYTVADSLGYIAIQRGQAQRSDSPDALFEPPSNFNASHTGILDPETRAVYSVPSGRSFSNSSAIPHYSIGDARLVDSCNLEGQAYSSSGYNNFCSIPTVIKNYQGLPGTAGTGAIVEPSMLYFPQGWNGWEYWLAAMPFDGGNAQYENPSIFVSHDGRNWTTPAGVSNPLVLPPNATDNNFDNTLFMAEDGATMCLAFGQTAGTSSGLWYMTSTDGVNWTAPVAMSGTTFAKATHYLQTPCPFYDSVAGQWTMYSVDIPGGTGGVVVSQTATSLAGPWSAPAAVTSNFPPSETAVFHMDLKRGPGNEIIGLAMCGDNTGGRCYPVRIMPTSTGFGTTMQFGPLIRPVNLRLNQHALYRCTAVPVGNQWKALFGSFGIGPNSYAMIPGTIEFDSPTYFSALYSRNAALMPNAQFTGTLGTMASYSGGLFWDSFNHATLGNCTASGGASATAWTTSGTGTLAITSNLLNQTVSGSNHIYVNSGSADIDYQVVINTLGGGFYVTFRLQDTSNFLRVYCSTGLFILAKVVGGTPTNLVGVIVSASDANSTLRILAKGNSIKVYWEGLQIIDYNTSQFNTATSHGMFFSADVTTKVANALMALPR